LFVFCLLVCCVDFRTEITETPALFGLLDSILIMNLVRDSEMCEIMKNAVFWDVIPCGSCTNHHLGRNYPIYHQADKKQRAKKSFSGI
jgi:hypothetical protein